MLAILLVALKFYFAIWYFPITLDGQITAELMPITLKFLLGVDQTWIVIELYLRTGYSIKLMESTHRID